MKQKIILLTAICLLLGSCYGKITKNPSYISVSTLTTEKNTFEYGEYIKLSDIFTNDYDFGDEYLDTFTMGENTVSIVYKNNNERFEEYFTYTVVDTTAPVIYVDTAYSVTVGETTPLEDLIICADNETRDLNCIITGEYDVNKVGSYKLSETATDNSGNTTTKEFILKVKKASSNASEKESVNISDVIQKYKTDDTLIGIDVSKWQGNIDFNKVKEAGVEFVMIRLGYQTGFGNDEYELDPYYETNIKNAQEAGLKIGIYFYSYATNNEEAIKGANFVLDNIKDYDITMPIAFDWESFKKFNSLNINITDLRNASMAFQKQIKDAGYTPTSYGSKNYLNTFWLPVKYDTWLAHYTDETNYDKDYNMWQMTNTGKVDGISGDVDIDIYYLNK